MKNGHVCYITGILSIQLQFSLRTFPYFSLISRKCVPMKLDLHFILYTYTASLESWSVIVMQNPSHYPVIRAICEKKVKFWPCSNRTHDFQTYVLVPNRLNYNSLCGKPPFLLTHRKHFIRSIQNSCMKK